MTCCFTGSRPGKLFGYDHNKYWPLVKKIQTEARTLYKNGFTTFITGGAQGVDQIAFWAIHEAKRRCPNMKNIVYEPFVGHDRIWRNTGLFSKSEYATIVRYADDVIAVTQDVDTNDRQQIVDALHARNHAIVDASTLVFAITNDDWKNPEARGATVECLRYAERTDKNIVVLDPFSLERRK